MNKRTVYIEPGDFAAGLKLTDSYKTILGSCVSAVFWEPNTQFFAMCHFLLPKAPAVQAGQLGRYGNQVLPEMLRLAKGASVEPNDMQVYLFGGASSEKTRGLAERFKVASNNLRYALRFVEHYGLKLVHQDIGGHCGRRVLVDANTGAFACQMVESAEYGVAYGQKN
ncbi:chemotaxis protein CheD [Pseudoalteromonas piscicida]|uniref:chemotaxis protein CheD n=1 Tax=Pseudoalteromonas piscicida TaxID=43662 RepID=UPI0030B67A76